jgi:DNA-binding transcriptional LysR family regulator
MRYTHTLRPMNLDLLRSFAAVAELGSLSRAAERLRVAQSTVTRQMRTLEGHVGGPLFERESTGVALTGAGHALLGGMRPVLAQLDAVIADTRRRARGQFGSLRIGYLASAADYLHPALARLRRTMPEVKVHLADLSPGQQIDALRRGEIDLAIVGQAGRLLAREFYLRRVASAPVMAALPESHPRAGEAGVALRLLREDPFVGAAESDMPGYNRWVAGLCRRSGFRARFLGDAESLTHGLAMVVTDGAVFLLPEYSAGRRAPGVVYRPITSPSLTCDLTVAWQRGPASEALKLVVEQLSAPPAQRGNA